MKSLVTGCAGFIGSHLCEALLASGHEVIGVDSFNDFYDPKIKERNIAMCLENPGFTLVRKNILDINIHDIAQIANGCDFIFHLAAQAGVRTSWGSGFSAYTRNNVEATQRLLEACKSSGIKKFVYASSSSVYGNQAPPFREDMAPMPFSPYGVTKLAGEHLCHLYHKNYGVPAVALRYFTVYGPRQRPDMAIHIFIESVLRSRPLMLYGDGSQKRDFTFVSDIVDANMLAAESEIKGGCINIGGGSIISVKELVEIIEEATGVDAIIKNMDVQPGDVRETLADITNAKKMGYKPKAVLNQGIKRQVEWHLSHKP